MADRSGRHRYARFGSVRLKVFLLYAAILLGTFFVFSACVHQYFRHEIYQKVDALLDVRASGLESAVKTYLATRKVDAPSGLAAFFSGYKNNDEKRFLVIADLLTGPELPEPERRLRTAAQIFDLNGRPIAESGAVQSAAYLEPQILSRALRGEKIVRSFDLMNRDLKPVRVRANTRTVMDGPHPRYIIRVLMPLKPVEEELTRLRRVLALLVLIMLLVTSWAGILLVRVTLQPVDRIVRKIREIRSDNLGERLYLHDTGDEINRLAQTFNEMLERLEKSFEAQKQIVQDLSHELKTPLTILRGQLEVALKKPRSQDEYAALLHASVSEIENIRRIIDDLLMLARLDSRAGTLEMKSLDLKPLLEGLLEDVKILAQTKKISVEFTSSGDSTLQANQIHLKRLFMNLLDNAVKYTPENGHIRVELKSGPADVRIRVADSGRGINAEHLPHIFDRFYRGERGQRGDSYGLGLSIVKSIVESHQGRIEVESPPGAGAAFVVSLPKKRNMQLFLAELLKGRPPGPKAST